MKPGHPDNRLIWEMYNEGNSSAQLDMSSDCDWKNAPPQHTRILDDIGVAIKFNDQVDDDGDRYYAGWEIYNLEPSGMVSSTRPLDWTYSDDELSLDDLETQVRKQFQATGRPTFGGI